MANKCVVYCPLPYNGEGPAQTCISILEKFPSTFETQLIIPRISKPVPDSIVVVQSVPYLLRRMPWRLIKHIAYNSLEASFLRNLQRSKTSPYIAYFMPSPPIHLIASARESGAITVREMINCFRGTARRILDRAYARHGLKSDLDISDSSIELEKKELSQYDYIFASNPLVEESLEEAGVPKRKILPSSFGWAPSRFSKF